MTDPDLQIRPGPPRIQPPEPAGRAPVPSVAGADPRSRRVRITVRGLMPNEGLVTLARQLAGRLERASGRVLGWNVIVEHRQLRSAREAAFRARLLTEVRAAAPIEISSCADDPMLAVRSAFDAVERLLVPSRPAALALG